MRSAILGLALVPIVFWGSASAQPGEPGIPAPHSVAPTSSPTYGGRRPLLKNLSGEKQKELAGLINQYTYANHDAVVNDHMNTTMGDPLLFDVHFAPYAHIFSWHHDYIQGLETWLSSNGHKEFVPLPKWIPSDPIPPAFGDGTIGITVDPNDNSFDRANPLIDDFDPQEDWSAFADSPGDQKLKAYIEDVRKGPADTTPGDLILADTLVRIHNDTHNTIGGNMASMGSPSVPIFWCYHAFIDDIWVRWQEVAGQFSHRLKETYQHPDGRQRHYFGEVIAAPGSATDTDIIPGFATLRTSGGGATGEQFHTYNIVNEPFLSILQNANGRHVWVEGQRNSRDSIVVKSVMGYNGPSAVDVLATTDPTSAKIGRIEKSMEATVTGLVDDGNGRSFYEVQLDSGQKGFVPVSAIAVGRPDRALSGEHGSSLPVRPAASSTPGVSGAMDGMNMGHPR